MTCDHCGKLIRPDSKPVLTIHQYGKIFCSYECQDASKAASLSP